MLIWRGLGILIAITGFASMIITQKVVNGLMDQENFYSDHGWPKSLAMVISAILVYLFSLFRPEKSFIVIDKKTNQEIETRTGDSLFFIPSRYWPFIFLGLAVVVFFL